MGAICKTLMRPVPVYSGYRSMSPLVSAVWMSDPDISNERLTWIPASSKASA